MEDQSFRELLSVYREGDSECAAARFDEAQKRAQTDPSLAKWWTEEKELDRMIAIKLRDAPVAAGLKARLLRPPEAIVPVRTPWARRLALLAATIVLLAFFFSSRRGVFQPPASLADYRDEMVSFVRVDPSLELETSELPRVSEFLGKTGAPSPLKFPEKLQQMKPVGCRTLRFRGNDVALICFKRGEGKLLHLFVVNRSALPKMPDSGGPAYFAQGEWMTAAWAEGNQTYLMTVQGDRSTLEKYLPSS